MVDVATLGQQKLEALVEMMVLAAAADGEFSEVELEHLNKSVLALTGGSFGAEQVQAVVARVSAELKASGRESCLKTVKQKLPELGARKAAFSVAAELSAADGIIRTSERELLLEVAEMLEIDPEEAADIVKRVESEAD